MITKVRIIKEGGVYKIQEYKDVGWLMTCMVWRYVSLIDDYGNWIDIPGFKTEKEAEEYVEKNYITRLIKEYNVEGLIEKNKVV